MRIFFLCDDQAPASRVKAVAASKECCRSHREVVESGTGSGVE